MGVGLDGTNGRGMSGHGTSSRHRRGVRGRGVVTALLAAVAVAACSGATGAGGAASTPAPAPATTGTPITAAEAVAVFDSAWSRIDRTYYDSTFHGLDWDAVRRELRPEAERAGTVQRLRAVLTDMVSRLGESHFTIVPAEVADALDPDAVRGGRGEPGEVGVEIRVLGDTLVVSRVASGSVADRAGIRPGWVVERIDTLSAHQLTRMLHAMGGDRRLAAARVAWAVEARLAGAVGDTVHAAFLDGRDRTVERALVPTPISGTPVRFGNLPTMFASLTHREIPAGDGCVGLIRFNVWMTPILPEFERAFLSLRHCDGMILDLRGNPGGVAGMVMGVSGYFMDQREALGRMKTRQGELQLVSMPRRVTTAGDPMTPFAGPLALVVDGQSMSTSEIFAGGLQGLGRARVFGDTTGGQALPALMVRLPNRDVLMYVFADYVGPDGTRIEGRGVVPDREVPLRRADLLAGRDAPVQAAVEWIERNASTASSPGGAELH